jgi:hydroxymethylglutaryl-CoA reductase
MSLHARNVAITAGATPDIVDQVVAAMVKARKVRLDYAQELVSQLKGK